MMSNSLSVRLVVIAVLGGVAWLAASQSLGPEIRPVSRVGQVDDLTVRSVTERPDGIELALVNDNARTVTIAQVQVDKAYWRYALVPDEPLEPGDGATLRVNLPWDPAIQHDVTLVTTTGATIVISLQALAAQAPPAVRSAGQLLPLAVATGLPLLALVWRGGRRDPLRGQGLLAAAALVLLVGLLVLELLRGFEAAQYVIGSLHGTVPYGLTVVSGYAAAVAIEFAATKWRASSALEVIGMSAVLLSACSVGISVAYALANGEAAEANGHMTAVALRHATLAAILVLAGAAPASPGAAAVLSLAVAASAVAALAASPMLTLDAWEVALIGLASGATGRLVLRAWPFQSHGAVAGQAAGTPSTG